MDPASSEISRNGETTRLEVRTLRLLVCLAEHAGDVVGIDELLKQVWPEVTVTADSVYQAVAALRRALGDDPKQPAYIATVPRLGYRMVASVSPWTDEPVTATDELHLRRPVAWAAGAAMVCVALAVAILFRAGAPKVTSIAVLPFLDLTEKMAEEEFADGVTEELIDRLNTIPGLRVPPPTSSFSFKNKRRSVAEIARALNVAYVVDGSTRKSGERLRVAARLIRADSGVVVWSESYERPWGDILTTQDAIADEMTKALKASIESRP